MIVRPLDVGASRLVAVGELTGPGRVEVASAPVDESECNRPVGEFGSVRIGRVGHRAEPVEVGRGRSGRGRPGRGRNHQRQGDEELPDDSLHPGWLTSRLLDSASQESRLGVLRRSTWHGDTGPAIRTRPDGRSRNPLKTTDRDGPRVYQGCDLASVAGVAPPSFFPAGVIADEAIVDGLPILTGAS